MSKKNTCRGCGRPRVVVDARFSGQRYCCPHCAGKELNVKVDPTDAAKVLEVEGLALRNCAYAVSLRAFVRELNKVIALAEGFVKAHGERCRCYYCSTNPNAAWHAKHDLTSFLWVARIARDLAAGGYIADPDEDALLDKRVEVEAVAKPRPALRLELAAAGR